MLGVQASAVVKLLVGKIQSAVLHSSSAAMYVVVPPNQVPYGLGRLAKKERDAKVAAHQAMWKAEFDSCDSLSIQKATVLFDQESMYSDDRDLGLELWLILPASADGEDAGIKNVFASSTLVKRKAVPGLVLAMERSSMSNFGQDLQFASSGSTPGDADLERSGACFSDLVLVSVLIACYQRFCLLEHLRQAVVQWTQVPDGDHFGCCEEHKVEQ